MNFKNFLLQQENVAVLNQKTSMGNGMGNDNDQFDDNGDNNDDEFWEWDKLSRYDSALMSWSNQSEFAKRIKTSILNLIFKKQPSFDFKEHNPDSDEYEHDFAPTGEIVLQVEWKLPEVDIEEKLYNTLRSPQSDLWKPLQIEANELWHTLDKGDVFLYVWYHIKSSLLGRNVEYETQYYDPNKPDGQKFDDRYFGLQRAWEKDKLTFEKYTKFKIYEMKNELEEQVKSYLPFEAEVQKIKESVRALVWQENFDASAYIYYRYERIK